MVPGQKIYEGVTVNELVDPMRITFPPLGDLGIVEDLPKFDVLGHYKLPKEVKFCKRCVVSNQRPRIRFDAEGVCSACRFAERKNTRFDWKEREKKLRDLLDRHRRKDGRWDVVVPSSGGKDSTNVAWHLKYTYGMNPLLVTWAPHSYTHVGWRNFLRLIHAGFDCIWGMPNGKLHRLLTRLSLIYMGDCFQPFIYGQKAFPMRIAVNYKIPLVMYGEDGEVEYGGYAGDTAEYEGRATHNVSTDMIKNYFSGILPEDFAKYGIDERDLHFYKAPTEEEAAEVGLENHFFGYYRKWIPQENYYLASEKTGLEPEPDGRSEGTYSKYASLDDRIAGFHHYFAYIKFGLGRCTWDAAHEIRDGHITREEGVALVRRFDGEFPAKHFQHFLEYVDLTEEYFWKVVDRFRSDHIWEQVNGEWRLRHQVT